MITILLTLMGKMILKHLKESSSIIFLGRKDKTILKLNGSLQRKLMQGLNYWSKEDLLLK